jgi:hypothetical protein
VEWSLDLSSQNFSPSPAQKEFGKLCEENRDFSAETDTRKPNDPPPRKREANMTEANSLVSEQQAMQFRQEGYFVLERVIPEGHLEALRS